MPASGPVSSRSSPSSRLISVDLPELGRPTTAMRIGLVAWPPRRRFRLRHRPARVGRGHGRIGKHRTQRLVEIGEALAMLGGDRDRLAQSELVSLEYTGPRCPALALVGDQDRGLARAAHEIGKRAIGWQRPARAWIRNRIASAPAIAASVCSCMRPLRLSGAASSRPAVSMTRTRDRRVAPGPRADRA